MTPADRLFVPLDGITYESRSALVAALLAIWCSMLDDIPPGYTPQSALRWGMRNGWIVPAGAHGYRVAYDGVRRRAMQGVHSY